MQTAGTPRRVGAASHGVRSATAMVGTPRRREASTRAAWAGWRCGVDRPDHDGVERGPRARPESRRSRRRSGEPRRRPPRPTANRVRSARASPGATVDEVSAGVRSVGLGHDGEDAASDGAGRSGRLAAVGRRRGSASAPPARARAPRASAEPTTSRSGWRPGARQPARAGRRAGRSRRRGRPASNRPRAAAATSVASIRRRAVAIGGAQQQVHAGPDRGDRPRPPAPHPGRAPACRARR